MKKVLIVGDAGQGLSFAIKMIELSTINHAKVVTTEDSKNLGLINNSSILNTLTKPLDLQLTVPTIIENNGISNRAERRKRKRNEKKRQLSSHTRK